MQYMSRLANKTITIPDGVSVKNEGELWIFSGPKGELKKKVHRGITVEQKNGSLAVLLKADTPKDAYAMLGTTWALLKSCIEGVKNGYEKKLEIEGVGYRAQMDGSGLILFLGFTHPIKITPPTGVAFKVEKNTILVSGADKEMVGQAAADIRAKKPPEPYKGKGIHYFGEIIKRKAGKKAVAAA